MLRKIHSLPGLIAAVLVAFMALTGALLSLQPALEHFGTPAPKSSVSVAELAANVAASHEGVQRIVETASGSTIVYSSGTNGAVANLVDPATGRDLGTYQSSGFFSFLTELHRSLFLGQAGHAVAGVGALALVVLAISGILMLVSRLGGWAKLFATARGTLRQRLHVDIGRIAVLGLMLSALTGVYMSLVSFGLISDGTAGLGLSFPPAGSGTASVAISELSALKSISLTDLRELVFPSPTDAADVFTVTTGSGSGYVDQSTGDMLQFTANNIGQTIYQAFYTLHTGQGIWWLGLVLGVTALTLPLMAVSGALVWWARTRNRPRLAGNAAPGQADTVILVGSEGNATWGFASELHDQLRKAGANVHTAEMNSFGRGYPRATRLIILTSTFGNGTAPASAKRFLALAAKLKTAPAFAYTVLGFGDHSFQHFSAYADLVDSSLSEMGWKRFHSLSHIDRQSSQAFAQWGVSIGQRIGKPLHLKYVPPQPKTVPLQLIDRVEYGIEIQAPTVILRFALPAEKRGLFGLGKPALPRFEAGDLLGIVPPGFAIPRYYSLASGSKDGFIEICVRKQQGGICSEFLFGLDEGGTIDAFIRHNSDFRPAPGRKPVVMVANGTGVAPFVGFIWNNKRKRPMHLYWGGRRPDSDFLYDNSLSACVADKRLATRVNAFSRSADHVYVQDRIAADPENIRALVASGAQFLICGSKDMANAVANAIDEILAPLGDSIDHLRAQGGILKTSIDIAYALPVSTVSATAGGAIEAVAPPAPLKRGALSGATMGTRYSAAFYSSAPVDMPRLSTALQQAVDRVDNQMSTWKPESDLCRLNRAPVGLWQVVPPELMTVLVAGLEIGKASGGAFDMGVGDAVDAWGFGAAGPSADQNKIGGAPSMRRPSTDGLELDAPNLRVRKTSAVQLDLSGIAKGFGVDQLAECLERFGITRYFVSIDGEVRASGLKPGGEPWLVGIEKPDRKMRDVARIQELADLALATSGDYRHFREHDGKWVSHTIDPRTGAPVDNAVTSVSVAAQSCMMADAWATALLVLGEVRGPELAEALQLSALFMVRDGDGLREIATGMFRE